MIIAIIFLPMTRGSRLDTFIAIILIVIMNAQMKIFVFSKLKLLFVVLPLLIIAAIFMSAIGVIRSTVGERQFSYASNLDLKVSGGYFDVISFAYGYFALPFENLDRLIRNNLKVRTAGEFSTMPLFNSFSEFDRLFGFPNMGYIDKFCDPVTPTGVHTALSVFYLDFGPVFAAIPMIIYMFIWLWLFKNQYRYHIALSVIYALYSAHFALVSFQPLMISPALYRRIAIVALPFIVFEILRTSSVRKKENLQKEYAYPH